MTFKVFLQNKTNENIFSNDIDIFVLIKKIVGSDVGDIKYVWYNMNTQSFNDRKTFDTEEDAKEDILMAFCHATEVCGKKIVGISLDYDVEQNVQGEIK